MAEVPIGPNAVFFEDLSPGARFVTQGRTVTDSDGLLWAMFTGDMNPMHVDEEFASAHGLFGGRFPPGLMVVAIASGLKERLGLFAGTGLAMVRQTVQYHNAVLPGDTIHVELLVREAVRHLTRPRGRVTFEYAVRKQDDSVVLDGHWEMVVRARGVGTSEGPSPT